MGKAVAEDTFAPSETHRFKETNEARRFRFSVAPQAVFISSQGKSLHGGGLAADLSEAISQHLAVGASFERPFFLPDSFSSLFTSLSLYLDYAITGSLLSRKHSVSLNDEEMLREESLSQGGLRVQLYLTQYSFSSSSTSVSFSGAGLGAVHKFPATGEINFSLGLRVDAVSNVQETLYPVKPFAQISLWL